MSMSSKTDRTWWLRDVRDIASESPYTFHLPSDQAIAALREGDGVKLFFAPSIEKPDGPASERMWVRITACTDGGFSGELDSQPMTIEGLNRGGQIVFEPQHIADVSIDDPEGSRFEQYFRRCIVTRAILEREAEVGYLYREEPDRPDDSGWRILSGDESDDYANDPANLLYVALGAVLNINDDFVGLLSKPSGSAYERAIDGSFVESSIGRD